MSDLTPETLRELALDNALAQMTWDEAYLALKAHADAWEVDRLAGHEWRIEGEGLRKRLKEAERRLAEWEKLRAGWKEADDECHHEWTPFPHGYPLVRCIKCDETRAE